MPTSEGPETGGNRVLSGAKTPRFSHDGSPPFPSLLPVPADDESGIVVSSVSPGAQEVSRRSRRRLGVLLGRFIVGRLYRNPDGYWAARVRDAQTGKVFRMSSGSTNVREAPAALDELLKSIEDGQSSTKAVLDAYQDLLNKKTAPEIPPFQMGESKDFESPCWRAVYPEYLKKKRHCSAKDEKRWLQAEAIYGEVFGDKSVEEISVDDIEALKTRLKAKERTPRTIRGHLFNLRSFFKWAIKEGKTRCPNPCDDIEIPKAHQERDGSPFSHEEARRLLHACQEPVCREVKYRDGSTEVQVRPPPEHLPLAVHIALQTGLRKSNILRLTWRDPLCLRSLRQPLPRY